MESSTLIPFDLSEGDKFAMLVMSVLDPPRQNFKLPSGIRIYNRFPNDILPDHWREWMGSIAVKDLEKSQLVILTSMPSSKPDIQDAEDDELERQVSAMIVPTSLQRVRIFASPVLISGSVVDGRLNFKRKGTYRQPAWLKQTPHNPITRHSLYAINELTRTITSLHSAGTHKRFLRGLKMVIRTWEDQDAFERMNYVARALDALAATGKGNGKKDFMQRCKFFMGNSAFWKDFFGKQYERRNASIHMSELEELRLAPDFEVAAKRIDRANWKAELIAAEIYRKILTTPNLLAQFESDQTISAFWKLPDADILTTIGKPMNLGRIRSESKRKQDRYDRIRSK